MMNLHSGRNLNASTNHTASINIVCQSLAADRWFFPDTPVSNKTYRHDLSFFIYSKASNEIKIKRELKAQIESVLNGNVSVHPVLCPRTAKIVRVFVSSALTGMK
jgi:hypothetical protein